MRCLKHMSSGFSSVLRKGCLNLLLCMLACPGFTLLTTFSPPGGCLKRSCVRFFVHSLGMIWRHLFSIFIVHVCSFPRMQTRKRSHLPCLSYPLIPFLHFPFLFFHIFSCSLSLCAWTEMKLILPVKLFLSHYAKWRYSESNNLPLYIY